MRFMSFFFSFDVHCEMFAFSFSMNVNVPADPVLPGLSGAVSYSWTLVFQAKILEPSVALLSRIFG